LKEWIYEDETWATATTTMTTDGFALPSDMVADNGLRYWPAGFR
jgi:hypothetical protein